MQARAKKTIAFYSNPSSLGGSEVYLKALLDNIDYSKYDVLFFCPRGHPLYNFATEKRCIQVIHILGLGNNGGAEFPQRSKEVSGKTRKNIKQLIKDIFPLTGMLFLGTFKEVKCLKMLFKKYPVDLIHFNDTGCEPPVIAAKLAGIKHITGTLHVLPSYERVKMTWVHRLVEHISVRSMDKIIAVSCAAKEAWMKRTGVPSEKIVVIHNGVDLSRFDAKVDIVKKKALLGIPQDRYIVSVPARLHPMKGHKYLIDAIPQIQRVIPKIMFLFIGDGPLKEELQKRVVDLRIDEQIRFLGHREDMVELLHLSDLVVLPSIALEAFPFALIEAQACSRAVVASNFSGIPEVVKDEETGILVPPRDSEALAGTIIKLLKDDLTRKKMGSAGRKRVEEFFTRQKMIEVTFKLYEGLLNG